MGRSSRKCSKTCSNLAHSKCFWFTSILILIGVVVGVVVSIILKKRNQHDTTAFFYNPDRGLFTQWDIFASKYEPPTPWELGEMRRTGNSVVHFPVYLDKFASSALSDSFLSDFNGLLSSVRDQGLKVILRFAYSDNQNTNPQDATKALILQHIGQLTPVLRGNLDVILLIEAGFIGVWGEWYYTTNFGNQGIVSTSQWADRVDILTAILNMVPGKMVLLRTPAFKQRYLGMDPSTLTATPNVNASVAYTSATAARIGFHNDCFLGTDNDMGTYRGPLDLQYTQAETLYVPMEGESCTAADPSTYTCSTSQQRLTTEHFSLLNDAHHPDIIKYWQTNGCWNNIVKSLGYRLMYSAPAWYGSARVGRVGTGGNFRLTGWNSMGISNQGNAAPFNQYVAEVLLVPTTMMNGTMEATGTGYVGQLALDIRRIAGGQTNFVINETAFDINPSSLGIGSSSYGVFLNIRSPKTSLSARPEYRIVFSNDESSIPDITQAPFWTQSRINYLAYNITVQPSAIVAENRTAAAVVQMTSATFVLKSGLLSWSQ
ncbi:hypothetical protein HDV00_012265 [Rhizophlyctis rosea]|nr:hypothetical protein HDV00_012265 [Rhizophlyctis rosea]